MSKVRHSAILNLDGKTLEGGGQLLRLALSLSCLTGRGIRVTDIRGNRTRGRGKLATKGGGLKSSHYECTQWLARASNAHVEGLHVGSSELLFQPRLGLAKEGFGFDAVLDETLAAEQGEKRRDGVDTADAQGNSRRKYEIRAAAPRRLTITQKTPGAVYLIVQALLPYLLFGPCCLPRVGRAGGEGGEDGRDGQDGQDAPAVPTPDVVLRIFGGTNVSSSPSHEYTTQVLLPTLTDHVGLPPVRSTLLRRGWSTPASTPGGTASAFDLGEIELTLTPNEPGRPLPAFTMTDDRRGDLHSFDVSVIANPPSLLQELELRIHSDLNDRFPGVTVQTVVREDSGRTNRVYVLVVAKVNTADQNADGDDEGNGEGNGKLYRLGRDLLFDGREKGGGKALAVQIAKAVVRDISSEVAHGGCVDEHLHDQLVVFQALARGTSRVTRGTSPPSLHTQTARWVAEQILDGLEFKSNGKCKGFGFVPGSGLEIES